MKKLTVASNMFNEIDALPRWFGFVKEIADGGILIVDSGSTDGTVEYAKAEGAVAFGDRGDICEIALRDRQALSASIVCLWLQVRVDAPPVQPGMLLQRFAQRPVLTGRAEVHAPVCIDAQVFADQHHLVGAIPLELQR